eukprot:SAG25_NODE_358_length_9173_cov_7.599515_13_plen_114_part_01
MHGDPRPPELTAKGHTGVAHGSPFLALPHAAYSCLLVPSSTAAGCALLSAACRVACGRRVGRPAAGGSCLLLAAAGRRLAALKIYTFPDDFGGSYTFHDCESQPTLFMIPPYRD